MWRVPGESQRGYDLGRLPTIVLQVALSWTELNWTTKKVDRFTSMAVRITRGWNGCSPSCRLAVRWVRVIRDPGCVRPVSAPIHVPHPLCIMDKRWVET